ncbi:small GTP-binding protein [Histomonas meleagridis]|uniref:small GTP-binding protein n=1 Tax=Histomonas meleagridis TaxID=135588 RepID=UPI00355A7817|nr:small GTP-binding protein [Histomonas meleagridis]KAH0798687.1 small GTP-binding protein [Histomonas meleagridis]
MSEGIPTFKFLLIGNSGVGKTSLVTRLCEDKFYREKNPTIGVEFLTKNMKIQDNDVCLQIWDTAGQEKFRAITKSYYRNSVGVLAVFSITDHKSFESMSEWINGAQNLCETNVKILLVGNKVDLKSSRQVTLEEAQDLADSYSIKYIESSAESNTNVTEAFELVAREVYKAYISNEIVLSNNLFQQENTEEDKNDKRRCC